MTAAPSEEEQFPGGPLFRTSWTLLAGEGGDAMEDYSDLKGGVPATSVTGRIWGMPKKKKGMDRNRGDRKDKKKNSSAVETKCDDHAEIEDSRYGSQGSRKKKCRQLDVVI